MSKRLAREREQEPEQTVASSKRPKRGQRAVVHQLERNGSPLNPRPTTVDGLNEFQRANRAPVPSVSKSDTDLSLSSSSSSSSSSSASSNVALTGVSDAPETSQNKNISTQQKPKVMAQPPSYTRNARKAMTQVSVPVMPSQSDSNSKAQPDAPVFPTSNMSLSDLSFSTSSSASSSSSSSIPSFSSTVTSVSGSTERAETNNVSAQEVSAEPRDESAALTLSGVIKFWNEKLEGVEMVTKSAFLKALKAEIKVHPYILLFLTYTLCGREGIVNLTLAKAFLDGFGVGEVNLSERVVRITSSLIHSTTGAHGWFWGFLQQEDVDKVLKDAVHDGSFLLRVNHRKPGTLSLSYVSWMPLGCNANTVQRKIIHTLRVQWDNDERGIVARFVSSARSATWKKIGPYATIPHMLAYLSSANIIGTSFPTSPLSWELRPARFNKKKDGNMASASAETKAPVAAPVAAPTASSESSASSKSEVTTDMPVLPELELAKVPIFGGPQTPHMNMTFEGGPERVETAPLTTKIRK